MREFLREFLRGNILSILWGIPTNKRMGEIWGIPDLLSNKIGDCISLLSMIHSIAHSGGIPDLLPIGKY